MLYSLEIIMQYFTLDNVYMCVQMSKQDIDYKKQYRMLILVILSSHLKGDLPSVVTLLHRVSKCTSHSYNNLYPVKNKKSFQ